MMVRSMYGLMSKFNWTWDQVLNLYYPTYEILCDEVDNEAKEQKKAMSRKGRG